MSIALDWVGRKASFEEVWVKKKLEEEQEQNPWA